MILRKHFFLNRAYSFNCKPGREKNNIRIKYCSMKNLGTNPGIFIKPGLMVFAYPDFFNNNTWARAEERTKLKPIYYKSH